MKAKVYSYFSPDVEDLNSFQPASAEEYGFLVTLSVGVEGEPGDEIFYLMVCTPEWIRATFRAEQIVIGHHYLLVLNTNFENVSGASGLADGNTVSLRGLLFASAPTPVLIAHKVRKR